MKGDSFSGRKRFNSRDSLASNHHVNLRMKMIRTINLEHVGYRRWEMSKPTGK